MVNQTLLLALLALVGVAPAYAQGKTKIKTKQSRPVSAPGSAATGTDWSAKYANLVTAERLRTHLTVLASDEYEGRETGTKGQHMAAAYVAQQFKNAGLTDPLPAQANPYQQRFSVAQSTWAEDPTLKVGSTGYQWLVDFYGLGDSPFAEQTTVKPVFVGYGIDQPGYSDYAGLDVRGQDVLIALGEPTDAEGKARLSSDGSPTRWGQDYHAKARVATQKGARTTFLVSFSSPSNFAKQAARLAPTIARPTTAMGSGTVPSQPPLFFVAPAVGLHVLGTTEAAMQAYLAKTNAAGRPVRSPFSAVAMHIKAARTRTLLDTENVLGLVEGTDQKDDVIVVSAHHDHLGVRDGQVFNGADDDGSGTTALITVAEAFARAKKEGHGPQRSLLFLSVTGEEKGLLGSNYYTKHPVFLLANTEANLNVDMIGRTDPDHAGKPDYVYVIGSDKLSSELKAINEAQNKQYTQLDLDYRFDGDDPNRFYYRSDHYNFALNKVPVAFFFSGVHADYHQQSDEIDKIQFDKMEKRAKLIFHTAWALANRDERIVVDSNKP